MATLIDEKGLQHYADKMVKAENRKVGTKSLPTALTEIDAMIDSMKGKFEQAYGDALEESFENQENTFKVGTGMGEDSSETVENGFISIDKLEGKTLVNRLKGENKAVQLPHRIELDEMTIRPNTDYTFQSTSKNAVASFKQPKYKEVICQDEIELKDNLDINNKIELRSVEGQTLKNIVPNPVNFEKWTETRGAVTKGSAHIKIQATEATVKYGNGLSEINIDNLFKSNTTYTISFDYRTGGENIHNILISRWSPHTGPIGKYPPSSEWKTVRHTFTIGASDTSLHYLCFYIIPKENGVSLDYWGEIRNFVILEGDYTQKKVPSFVEGVQGVGRKSRNLFNKDTVRIEDEIQMLWDTGNTRALESFYTTDFIEIKPNTTYSLSGLTYASDARMVTFDENKRGIRENERRYEKITTKNNSKFIRICAKKENDIIPIDKIQLEESTCATPYEPYWEGYKIGVKTHGKNLIDWKVKNVESADKRHLVEYNEENQAIRLQSNFNSTYSLGTKFYVRRGEKIAITIEGMKEGVGHYSSLYLGDSSLSYFKNETWVITGVGTGGNIIETNDSFSTKRVVVSANKDGWVDRFVIHSAGEGNFYQIKKFQIEKNSEATAYEPYRESVNELILKEPLHAVGSIKDKLYFDGGYKIEKKFNQIVLNGSEDWKPYGQQSEGYFTGVTPALDGAHTGYVICDKFENTSIWSSNSSKEGIQLETFSTGEHLFIKIKSNKLESNNVEGLKKWLNANNLAVAYQLATPVVVDQQIKEQIKLDTYQLTYFTVDSGIAPSKTIIDVPVLEQVTGKSGALRTPNTLDRVYLDIQGSGEIEDMMLFEGEAKTKTYIGSIASVGNGELVINSCGKNLMKKMDPENPDQWFSSSGGGTGAIMYSPTEKAYYTSSYHRKLAIHGLIIGEKYTFSVDAKIKDKKETFQFTTHHHGYPSGFGADISTSWSKVEYTFTAKQDTFAVYIYSLYFKNIQLELGEDATEYEDYNGIEKTIKLKEPLRGLPNGAKDTIEKIDGEWKIIRRCCEKTFDGKERWVVNGINPSSKQSQELFYSSFDRPCLKDSSEGVGTGFISQGGPYNVDVECLSAYKSGLYVRIEKSKLETPTSEGFKKWLTSNPITLVYPLATPTIEPLSPLTLQAWKGGSLLIEDPINVASTHTVALNKPGQILKNIEELTILRDRVEKLEANYDQLALEQAHQLALTKQSIELDYEI